MGVTWETGRPAPCPQAMPVWGECPSLQLDRDLSLLSGRTARSIVKLASSTLRSQTEDASGTRAELHQIEGRVGNNAPVHEHGVTAEAATARVPARS